MLVDICRDILHLSLYLYNTRTASFPWESGCAWGISGTYILVTFRPFWPSQSFNFFVFIGFHIISVKCVYNVHFASIFTLHARVALNTWLRCGHMGTFTVNMNYIQRWHPVKSIAAHLTRPSWHTLGLVGWITDPQLPLIEWLRTHRHILSLGEVVSHVQI